MQVNRLENEKSDKRKGEGVDRLDGRGIAITGGAGGIGAAMGWLCAGPDAALGVSFTQVEAPPTEGERGAGTSDGDGSRLCSVESANDGSSLCLRRC